MESISLMNFLSPFQPNYGRTPSKWDKPKEAPPPPVNREFDESEVRLLFMLNFFISYYMVCAKRRNIKKISSMHHMPYSIFNWVE